MVLLDYGMPEVIRGQVRQGDVIQALGEICIIPGDFVLFFIISFLYTHGLKHATGKWHISNKFMKKWKWKTGTDMWKATFSLFVTFLPLRSSTHSSIFHLFCLPLSLTHRFWVKHIKPLLAAVTPRISLSHSWLKPHQNSVRHPKMCPSGIHRIPISHLPAAWDCAWASVIGRIGVLTRRVSSPLLLTV